MVVHTNHAERANADLACDIEPTPMMEMGHQELHDTETTLNHKSHKERHSQNENNYTNK